MKAVASNLSFSCGRRMNGLGRVVLADDQPDVRSALRLLLEQEAGTAVIGEVEDAQALLRIVGDTCPDIVMIDWELPGLEASSLLFNLRRACPLTCLVALSAQPDARRSALEAGVTAFVSKSESPESLLATLRRISWLVIPTRRTNGNH